MTIETVTTYICDRCGARCLDKRQPLNDNKEILGCADVRVTFKKTQISGKYSNDCDKTVEVYLCGDCAELLKKLLEPIKSNDKN